MEGVVRTLTEELPACDDVLSPHIHQGAVPVSEFDRAARKKEEKELVTAGEP